MTCALLLHPEDTPTSGKTNGASDVHARDTTVVATGYADIRAAGEAETYDRAIDDAQRKGIEQAQPFALDATGAVISGVDFDTHAATITVR